MKTLSKSILFTGIGLAVAFTLWAQVFPMRWDDEEVPTGAVTPLGVAVMDVIHLVPRDDNPVPCDEAHEGWAYFQRDILGDGTQSAFLCICVEAKGENPPGSSLGYMWILANHWDEDCDVPPSPRTPGLE